MVEILISVNAAAEIQFDDEGNGFGGPTTANFHFPYFFCCCCEIINNGPASMNRKGGNQEGRTAEGQS